MEYLGKQDNMVPIYAKADVMILPSYREGLSKSLIEACAMSPPVITTDVPAVEMLSKKDLMIFM